MTESSETHTEQRDVFAPGRHPNSLANLSKDSLTPWPSGQSGNPQGQSLIVIAREKLKDICPFDPKERTWYEVLSEDLLKQAKLSPRGMAELLDRLYGKVSQPISGDPENPIYVGLLAEIRENQKRVNDGTERPSED